MPIVDLDAFLAKNTHPAHFTCDVNLQDIIIRRVTPRNPVDISVLAGRGFRLEVLSVSSAWELKDGIGLARLLDFREKPTGYELSSHFSRGSKPDFWYELAREAGYAVNKRGSALMPRTDS